MSTERKEAANNNGYPTTVYGRAGSNALGNKGRAVADDGSKQEFVAEYSIDVTNLPSQSAVDPSVYTLPAGAVVQRVDLFVTETLSGGTTLSVGLNQPDGTVIDADGLVAAFAGTAVNAYAKGAGALIDTALAADAQLDVTTDRTAGAFVVRVYYTKAQS